LTVDRIEKRESSSSAPIQDLRDDRDMSETMMMMMMTPQETENHALETGDGLMSKCHRIHEGTPAATLPAFRHLQL
jgi:hypothetical protein